ncbi:MAG: hypothetical protein IGR92_05025 [Leptolyngbyaceae cyanobacterium T60_A2020_046]|nr:hypothetical protein [Leptolyngbyaceae cyanobacterium T60_A2020_046]
MKRLTQRSRLLQFTFHLTKYVLLGILGFVLICLITPVFAGGFDILETLFRVLLQSLWRIGIVLLCLLAIGVVTESLR